MVLSVVLATTRAALQPRPLSAESGQRVEQTSTESAVFHLLSASERDEVALA